MSKQSLLSTKKVTFKWGKCIEKIEQSTLVYNRTRDVAIALAWDRLPKPGYGYVLESVLVEESSND
jgi:hypothetical protein